MKNSIVSISEALGLVQKLGAEFALIHNPAYIHPPYELVPLAPKSVGPLEQVTALVMDMDGTTTTTEELCIHSLEYMVRSITGRMTKAEWTGLDHELDYPHIIGNSTTKHVEYLIHRYRHEIRNEAFRRAFLHAALWTLVEGKDAQRIREVETDLVNSGCGALLNDRTVVSLRKHGELTPQELASVLPPLDAQYGSCLGALSEADMVAAGIDIYYARYHQILGLITRGEASHLSLDLLGDEGRRLIEPMPGVAVTLALAKGWLGEDVQWLVDDVIEAYNHKAGHEYMPANVAAIKERLQRVGRVFEGRPAKVAVVTSSILFEAHIVITEVFRILATTVAQWPDRVRKKNWILDQFADYHNVYDAFVTATDSSEIRLKPHRDLYSIALRQLGISPERFATVVGFEDSESGTLAIRAAGIGLCVAVPFAQTSGHNLQAASYVLRGGLPETLLTHNLFLDHNTGV